jgi:hypothetical protein
MKVLVVSTGFYVMLCVLALHFVFVSVVMFILGIVFWMSFISGLGFLVLWNFCLQFPVLVLFWCCCMVLDCVACLVSNGKGVP